MQPTGIHIIVCLIPHETGCFLESLVSEYTKSVKYKLLREYVVPAGAVLAKTSQALSGR